MKELEITAEELNDLLTEQLGRLNIRTAALINDGVETYKKCGLLPSELLQQRDELREALTELVHLHGCEQEGIGSGQPTPQQWYDAVNKAEAAIKSTER